jgi:hypothetical protein
MDYEIPDLNTTEGRIAFLESELKNTQVRLTTLETQVAESHIRRKAQLLDDLRDINARIGLNLL